ncbi:hypothetical protein BJF79_39120 [Actinomadura sp. CNU-125]|nr:hypothetical protein [Actinomadura sp. CNU-125]OLT30405.1 hypothetical protein BJF79_39120 [Actinomadura sp. CNU-125]
MVDAHLQAEPGGAVGAQRHGHAGTAALALVDGRAVDDEPGVVQDPDEVGHRGLGEAGQLGEAGAGDGLVPGDVLQDDGEVPAAHRGVPDGDVPGVRHGRTLIQSRL